MAEEKKQEEKQAPHSPLKGGEKTVRAVLKVKHLIGDGGAEHEKEINDFLETIDNVSRFLNARNAYEMGGKSCVVVWYLEKLADEEVAEEFGEEVKIEE